MADVSLWLAIQAVEDRRLLADAPSPLPVSDRELVLRLLARQIDAGKERGAFDLRPEQGETIRLYTGERLRTKLAIRNVSSIEAAHALLALDPKSPDVTAAVRRTAEWLQCTCFALRHCVIGECAHSFASYLRFLQLHSPSEHDIARRLQVLRELRDGNGRWQRLPFYYTVLALADLPMEAARSELRYALPALERVRNRCKKNGMYEVRQKRLVERVFSLADQRLL